MQELERSIALAKFMKVTPDREFPLSNIGVMEKHNGIGGKLGSPNLKVFFDVVIAVASVNMKYIYTAVGKIG